MLRLLGMNKGMYFDVSKMHPMLDPSSGPHFSPWKLNKKEKEMQDYQLRVIEEKKELDAKLEKLAAFNVSDNFRDVSDLQRGLMVQQESVMGHYSNILGERITAFKSEEDE